MNPFFSLPYDEFNVACLLMSHFPKKKGYSVLVPASRQEKGIDLVLMQRESKKSQCLTIQVKSCRYWPGRRKGQYNHNTWFRKFEVAPEADWYTLFSLYPSDGPTMPRWIPIVWAFSHQQMSDFISGLGNEKFFYISFNDPKETFLTRPNRQPVPNLSQHLFEHKVNEIRQSIQSQH